MLTDTLIILYMFWPYGYVLKVEQTAKHFF